MFRLRKNFSKTLLYFFNVIAVKDCVRIVQQDPLGINFMDEVYSFLMKEHKKNKIYRLINKFFFKEKGILKNKFIFEFGI